MHQKKGERKKGGDGPALGWSVLRTKNKKYKPKILCQGREKSRRGNVKNRNLPWQAQRLEGTFGQYLCRRGKGWKGNITIRKNIRREQTSVTF